MNRLRHEFSAIVALTRRDVIRFSRDRSQVLGAFGRPLIWMLLFGTGLHHAFAAQMTNSFDYAQFAYAGAIAMTILFGGMFQGVTVVWDREFGMLRAVLVAPISRTAIALGKICAGTAVTMLQAIIAAAFAPLVGVSLSLLNILALLVTMTALSFAVTALGVLVGSRMRTFEGFGVISNFVILPLYFLSGGVFPLEGLPNWMRVLVLANPMTYGVDWMRACIGHPHAFAWSVDAALVLTFAAVACSGALFSFRRTAG